MAWYSRRSRFLTAWRPTAFFPAEEARGEALAAALRRHSVVNLLSIGMIRDDVEPKWNNQRWNEGKCGKYGDV